MRCAAFVVVCVLAVLICGFQPSAQVRQAPVRLTITVLVTNMEGQPLGEVWVKASGPVEREGSTDSAGTVVFNNVNAGAYRLRFEREGFITFEREVTVVAAKPLKATIALNAAPPPPPAPKVEPPPPAPTPTPPPPGNYQPTSVPIPDFFETNYIGSAPMKRSVLSCTASSTTSLIQMREPLAEHTHAEADEVIYIVAGEGTHKLEGREYAVSAGTLMVVPRGIAHSLVRKGSRPLILLSTLSGPPCQT